MHLSKEVKTLRDLAKAFNETLGVKVSVPVLSRKAKVGLLEIYIEFIPLKHVRKIHSE